MDTIAVKNPNKEQDGLKRVMIFTPTTGLVRMEWVVARYGQIIPCNWSHMENRQFLSAYIPIEYQLADAQNMLAREVVKRDIEWVLYIEHDNILPADAFMKMNEYMQKGDIPVVSGIYFTKSEPPEPILYRGMGNSYFRDWKMGEKVWVDGIPFGFRLEHASLIKAAWEESPEYNVGNIVTRRVFSQPQRLIENDGGFSAVMGTTDLEWCSRLMDDNLFEKAGWGKYQKKKYPFLVDTTINVGHINNDGRVFPLKMPKEFIKEPCPKKKH